MTSIELSPLEGNINGGGTGVFLSGRRNLNSRHSFFGGVVKRDLGAEAGEDVMFSVSLLSPVPHL